MTIVSSSGWNLLLGYRVDDCSPMRHRLARLGLCKHKYRWVGLKEAWEEAYSRNPTAETTYIHPLTGEEYFKS